MKYLLDVNVLLAALFRQNAHHGTATGWLDRKSVVLCPLTELGFLRISTNPRLGYAVPMEHARASLEQLARTLKADRIADDLNALESHPRRSNDVTDHYLADLAQKHGLKLATLDESIRHSAAELIA